MRPSGPDGFQEFSSKNVPSAGEFIGVFSTKCKTLQAGLGTGDKTKENLGFDIGKQAWEGSGVKTNCQVSFPAFDTKSLVLSADR